MKDTTRQLIMCSISTDPTITEDEKSALVAICNGKAPLDDSSNKPKDRVLKRAEVAKLYGVSIKAVDGYGRKGLIKRVFLGGSRAIGYSEASVQAALAAK